MYNVSRLRPYVGLCGHITCGEIWYDSDNEHGNIVVTAAAAANVEQIFSRGYKIFCVLAAAGCWPIGGAGCWEGWDAADQWEGADAGLGAGRDRGQPMAEHPRIRISHMSRSWAQHSTHSGLCLIAPPHSCSVWAWCYRNEWLLCVVSAVYLLCLLCMLSCVYCVWCVVWQGAGWRDAANEEESPSHSHGAEQSIAQHQQMEIPGPDGDYHHHPPANKEFLRLLSSRSVCVCSSRLHLLHQDLSIHQLNIWLCKILTESAVFFL